MRIAARSLLSCVASTTNDRFGRVGRRFADAHLVLAGGSLARVACATGDGTENLGRACPVSSFFRARRSLQTGRVYNKTPL